VTSPGGTTQAAVEVLDENGCEEILIRAVHAARERSIELAKLLGEQ
jgi:pyrroline-5-carboxylate reductase